jgi:UrcA family protein
MSRAERTSPTLVDPATALATLTVRQRESSAKDNMMKPANRFRIYPVMAGLILAGTAAPALAQPVQEEDIIVTGRYGVPDNAQTASERVSYADLDLGLASGRDTLKHRISLTARYLCDKLGETDTAPGITPSCRDAATRDAMNRVGTIEAHFAPRGTAWVARAPWKAPYPAAWDTRYP